MGAVTAEQFPEQYSITQVVGAALLAGAVRVGDEVFGHGQPIGAGQARLDSIPAERLEPGVVDAQVVGYLM